MARDRALSFADHTAGNERLDSAAGKTRERRDPERPPRVAPEVRDA